MEKIKNNVIWTMWWQGEDIAPPLVRACIKSIREYANGADVIVITQYNYRQYAEIPEYVIRKFEKGKFTVTQLSDFLRVTLLYCYGGLWLDSSILVTQPIPKTIFESCFYSLSGASNNNKNIAKGRWTAFLIAGKSGNETLGKIRDCCFQYWSNYDESICYGYFDFFLGMLYDCDEKTRKMIDSVPSYGGDIFELSKKMNKLAGEKIIYKSMFNKLSCKEIYDVETANGPTVYLSILQEYHETDKQKEKVARTNKKMKSLVGHLKKLCSAKRIKLFGFKICILEFVNACMRTSTGKMAQGFADMYNMAVLRFLKEVFKCG